MTSISPNCVFCKHFNTEVREKNVCVAFPEGIPQSIISGKVSHIWPVEGDHGVQFDPLPGFEYKLDETDTVGAK